VQLRRRCSACAVAIGPLLASALLAACGAPAVGSAQLPSGGSTPSAVTQAQRAATAVDPAIVEADNAFGLRLLQALLPASGGNSIAISPLSSALALQILYNGAAGATRQSMAQTLALGTMSTQTLNADNAALQASFINPDPKVQLTIANSLWIDQSGSPVLPFFTAMDETFYGATIGDLAGAPGNVNAWVDSETQGLIPTLLPAGHYVDAIIVNALYFKGEWTTRFDPAQTMMAPFTLADGSQVTAQLMQQTVSLPYTAGSLNGGDFQAVRIPYGAGRLGMLVVLPDASVDIGQFVGGLALSDVSGVIAQLRDSPVALALPRFTATYAASLIPALTSMGMGTAFGPTADFSALAPGFQVNKVLHDTVVEVDETGTVAAAATGIGVTTVAQPLAPMIVDHPFLYAIEDAATGELLFIGVLMNPA
jgi:serpin B